MFLIEDTAGAKVYDNAFNVKNVKVWRKNENVNIYNNVINSEVGIHIEGGGDGSLISKGTKIYNNTFHSSKDGVLIEAGTKETYINKNNFSGSGGNSGINLFASEDIQDIKVSNNSFSNYQNGV